MSSAVRRPARTAPAAFHSSWNCRTASDGSPVWPFASAHLCSRSPSSPPRKSLGSAMYPSSDIDMSSTDADTSTSCGLDSKLARVIYNQMVVDELMDEAVDQLFHALADPTRRDILRRCAAGEPSVSHLAQAYPMSFAAVQKHVAVLERAGLVTKERRGREQLVRTDFDAVRRA